MKARTSLPLILLFLPLATHAATLDEAATALRNAAGFFRETVSTHGGYLWQYSSDLTKREGEGRATALQVWVQSPGTPAVGEAFLDAYASTGDSFYLDAAREAANALLQGQLRSGGWDYRIEFDPEKRKNVAYKIEDTGGTFDTTTLDDGTTQAAVTFLVHFHQTTGKMNDAIGRAVAYAFDKLLAAQYPNGAWPQRFSAPPDPAKFPVVKASFPEMWPRDWVKHDYYGDYTFNDGTIADMINLMLLAHNVYGDPRYRESALRAGDFILLAQMPDPQPGWAQQYDAAMHPVWARKFEPPAITGGESQDILRTLIGLYKRTGERRFLLPVPRALAYFKSSLLPGGRLARFYELQTNKPLYFTQDYKLTYSSEDMPTHYAFIVDSSLDAIQAEYDNVAAVGPKVKRAPASPPEIDTARIDAIIHALDARGAWVDKAPLRYQDDADTTREIVSSATFERNVHELCRYIRSARKARIAK